MEEKTIPKLFDVTNDVNKVNTEETKNCDLKSSNSVREGLTNVMYTDLDRESDDSSFLVRNQAVNVSVSRNHLKLNIILRILMVIVLVANSCLIPWMRDMKCNVELKQNGELEHNCNYNPQWLFYNGIITGIAALLVFIFEILAILRIINYVMDYKIAWFKVSFYQRYNFVFIVVTLLIWFCLQRAWETMEGLSFGFYIMIGLVVWCFLLKFYYRYYKSKLYQRRIINQLLED